MRENLETGVKRPKQMRQLVNKIKEDFGEDFKAVKDDCLDKSLKVSLFVVLFFISLKINAYIWSEDM